MNILETQKYKDAPLKTYNSVAALSAATGIDPRILRKVKKLNLDGINVGNTINWKKLKPEFEKLYDELVEDFPSDIQTLKEENLKRDIKIKDLEIIKRERNMMDPEEVKSLLVSIATHQSVIIKKVLSELKPKVVGKTEPEVDIIVDECMSNIFIAMEEKLNKI